MDSVHRRFATVSKRDPDCQTNLPRHSVLPLMMVTGSFTWSD